jgi:hypothetical protein
MFTRKMLIAAALVSATSMAHAEDGFSTTFNGMFRFESAARNQKKIPSSEKNMSANKRDVVFDTEAHVSAIAQHETDAMKYGAKLSLQTSTKQSTSSTYNGSYIFTESDYGRWELGSGYDAGTAMRVTGCDVARGTCDNWTNYMWTPNGVPMLPTPGASFLNTNFADGNGTSIIETSRKITYFTPKFMDKVQFGVSYVPDTANVGLGTFNDSHKFLRSKTIELPNGTKYVNKQSAKDAFSAGASLTHNICDGVDVKVSATGEIGKAMNASKNDGNTTSSLKVANLKTYNIGAIVNYGSLSLAGSYSDRGKSFTTAEVDGNRTKTRVYTAAIGYAQGPAGISLMYALGDQQKNKVDSYTLGTDYKLAPGFVPYAEVTYFKGRGTRLPVYNDATRLTTKGTIALMGAKLSF